LLALALLILLVGAMPACQKQLAPPKQPKNTSLVPHLPEPPDYSKLASLQVRDPKGAWTVYGVSREKAGLLGQQVSVVGKVGERNTCTGQAGCPQRPYFMLVDAAAPQFSLMVVRQNDQGFAEFTTGREVNLVGTLVENTPEGTLFRSEGILVIPGGQDAPPPEAAPEVTQPAR
jgi:hypothetical protein